jgi:hypothetical protein
VGDPNPIGSARGRPAHERRRSPGALLYPVSGRIVRTMCFAGHAGCGRHTVSDSTSIASARSPVIGFVSRSGASRRCRTMAPRSPPQRPRPAWCRRKLGLCLYNILVRRSQASAHPTPPGNWLCFARSSRPAPVWQVTNWVCFAQSSARAGGGRSVPNPQHVIASEARQSTIGNRGIGFVPHDSPPNWVRFPKRGIEAMSHDWHRALGPRPTRCRQELALFCRCL